MKEKDYMFELNDVKVKCLILAMIQLSILKYLKITRETYWFQSKQDINLESCVQLHQSLKPMDATSTNAPKQTTPLLLNSSTQQLPWLAKGRQEHPLWDTLLPRVTLQIHVAAVVSDQTSPSKYCTDVRYSTLFFAHFCLSLTLSQLFL